MLTFRQNVLPASRKMVKEYRNKLMNCLTLVTNNGKENNI